MTGRIEQPLLMKSIFTNTKASQSKERNKNCNNNGLLNCYTIINLKQTTYYMDIYDR